MVRQIIFTITTTSENNVSPERGCFWRESLSVYYPFFALSYKISFQEERDRTACFGPLSACVAFWRAMHYIPSIIPLVCALQHCHFHSQDEDSFRQCHTRRDRNHESGWKWDFYTNISTGSTCKLWLIRDSSFMSLCSVCRYSIIHHRLVSTNYIGNHRRVLRQNGTLDGIGRIKFPLSMDDDGGGDMYMDKGYKLCGRVMWLTQSRNRETAPDDGQDFIWLLRCCMVYVFLT